MLAFQIGTGDIVEGFLDLVLTGAGIVERFAEVVFIEGGQPGHLGDGVIAGPTDSREHFRELLLGVRRVPVNRQSEPPKLTMYG